MRPLLCVSLFASAGIGDLALKGVGGEVLVANELLADRASLFEANYPECSMVLGDIRIVEQEIIKVAKARLAGRELDVLFATPPCQGMSKNGRGKLLNGIRAGQKPELDARNTLIINTLNVALALKPRVIVLENVPEMQSTIIEVDGEFVDIMDYIRRRLEPEYVGSWSVVEFANYGVPQRRQRLLTVFSREPALSRKLQKGPSAWLLEPTHSKHPSLLQEPWVTVGQAIGHLPPLDAKNSTTARSELPLHYVPVLDDEKYFWVSNTPPGKGAFDNQCVSPTCGYQNNPVHGASHGADGINRAHATTPIRCVACGELLPRPWVKKGGEYKLMSGFTSAYKRMRADLPASALTRNLFYACSDQKLHPTQHRVLSLCEAMIIHTLDKYEYKWKRADGRKVADKTIREAIGESIPPKGLEPIFRALLSNLTETAYVRRHAA